MEGLKMDKYLIASVHNYEVEIKKSPKRYSALKLTKQQKGVLATKEAIYKDAWYSHVKNIKRHRPEDDFMNPNRTLRIGEEIFEGITRLSDKDKLRLHKLLTKDRFVDESLDLDDDRVGRRQQIIKSATPIWADRVEIANIYAERNARNKTETDDPWEVDHYYPILGKNVTGLHVHTNLILIRRSENRKKTNIHPDIFYNLENI